MNERRWNWHLWAGFLFCLLGFASYPFVFAKFPITRDVPWANFLLFAIVVGLYALLAPSAGGAGLTMWAGFAIGQLYVIGRLWGKLAFWATETSLFQGRLAHAGYTARPEPVWPDSPAADAIRE